MSARPSHLRLRRAYAGRLRSTSFLARRLTTVGLAGAGVLGAGAALAVPAQAAGTPVLQIATPASTLHAAGWTTVTGALSSGGHRVAGEKVLLQSQRGSAGWTTLAATTTNAAGHLSVRTWVPGTEHLRLTHAPDAAAGSVGSRSIAVSVKPVVKVASVSRRGAEAVAIAAAQAGKPYVYGAAGPNAFDCSGLVRYVYGRLGVSLPHSATGQYALTQHISMSAVQPGDLVFTSLGGGRSASAIDHVGIYAGNGNWWVGRTPGTVIQLQHIWTSNVWVGRLS